MRTTAVFVTSIALLCSCQKAPTEPDPGPVATATPAASSLHWDAPPMWSALPKSPLEAQRGAYKVPKAGDAKADAELDVWFYGTGTPGDADKRFGDWAKQFEGPAAADLQRAPLGEAALPTETLEVHGRYKTSIGPHVGPNGKAPVEMLKENYRMLAAVVKTPDRGNWFFKLVGPEDTVQSARSAFYAMVRSAK